MNPSRHERLEALYLEALDLPETDRLRFAVQACENDPDLRAELLALLGIKEGLDSVVEFEGSVTEPVPRVADETPIASFRQIGRYPIMSELGRGGMGIVYLAQDQKLGREIALKVLPEHFSRDTSVRQRFQREAKLLAALNHPHIAVIHSLEEDADVHFLTMERIEGTTLSEVIRSGTLSLDRSLAINRQIASSLEAAHARDVVHRDLKPSNIMVNAEDQVKVLDFGLARSLSPNATVNLDEPLMGSPGYISPERLRGDVADPRVDVFALGCVLYECLTGCHAFEGDSAQARLNATIHREANLDRLPAEMPHAIRTLVAQCLEKDPEKRLSRMTDVRRTIEQTIDARAVARLLEGVMQATGPVPNNLPLSLTRFIGRDVEMEEIQSRLVENRLVTLTGVGGSGKSRLSVEVARRILDGYPDGAWFVELAPVTDGDQVEHAAATAMGLKEGPGMPLLRVLQTHLRDRRILIVLDNCEHVLEQAAQVATTILAAGPDTRVLATSREALGLDGESVTPVPPLPAPLEGAADIETSDAVRLFVDRAKSAGGAFELTPENAPHVAEICRRLDGIPLALELAATRMKTLSPAELARKLDQRFRILTGGKKAALPRHQTLQGLIDWSYEHLEEAEQAMLRRLSVFVGGWTLEAAEAVCSGETIGPWETLDVMTRLLDKSLVERETGATEETRYRMLETIRVYAREKLEEAGEGLEAGERHRDYYHALITAAEPELTGPDQRRWLDRLENDHENLIEAINWGAGEAAVQKSLEMVGKFSKFWEVRGHYALGRQTAEAVLLRDIAAAPTPARLCAVGTQIIMALRQSDLDTAHSRGEESLTLYREIGDQQGIALSLKQLGAVAWARGDAGTAEAHLKECLELFHRLGDRKNVGVTLSNLGDVSIHRGDDATAAVRFEESLQIARAESNERAVAVALSNLGNLAWQRGDESTARVRYEESLQLARGVGYQRTIGYSLMRLGLLSWTLEDHEVARAQIQECLDVYRRTGDREFTSPALNALGMVLWSQGDDLAARQNYNQSLDIIREIGSQDLEGVLIGLAAIAVRQNPARAARCLSAAGRESDNLRRRLGLAELKLLEMAAGMAREALGEDAFTRAWESGSSLSLDAAIEEALGRVQPARAD